MSQHGTCVCEVQDTFHHHGGCAGPLTNDDRGENDENGHGTLPVLHRLEFSKEGLECRHYRQQC